MGKTKKILSIFVLLLANMVMLALPVVRYIQHNTLTPIAVCSENQKRNYCKHSEQQNCPNTTNEKKGCDREKCLLRNLFFQDSNIKLSKPIFNFIISDILACQVIHITDFAGLPFRHKPPYIPPLYANFFSQSIGLRAPPAC